MSDVNRPYLVFSDVDETLITVTSMSDFLRYQLVRRHGTAGQEEFERITGLARRRAAGGASGADINRFCHSHYAGESVATITQLADEWFAERSLFTGGFLIDSTRRALAGHRAAGAALVLVSDAFSPLLEPLARQVGAETILCTRPLTVEGRYTGEVAAPVTGEGKRAAVQRQLAARPDVDPRDCYAYGAHLSDPSVLELVGHPVTVGVEGELCERLPAQAASVRI